jgi:hypothetical protein
MVALIAFSALAIGGCTGGVPDESSRETSSPRQAAQTTSVPSPAATSDIGPSAPTIGTPAPIIDIGCRPNLNDACVGLLSARVHRSANFQPGLTYEVPAGWADHADSRGEYYLLAPGSKPNASEFGARDAIAFEANVTFTPAGCDAKPRFDASKTAVDIAAWMARRTNLVTTSPRPASIGGLKGTALDVRLAPNAPIECFPVPAVNLVHGLPPSDGYDQAILAGTAMRFYFFDHGRDVLMIEIDDVSGGARLSEFAAVLDTVVFSPHP